MKALTLVIGSTLLLGAAGAMANENNMARASQTPKSR